MAVLKQSTSYARAFMMVQSADHISGLTGATVTVNLSKAGAAFAAAAGAVTEIGNGWYKVTLSTADVNTLGDLAYHCTATLGDPTDFVDQVAANILGDTLPASVAGNIGGNVNGNVVGSVGSVTGNVGGNLVGNVNGNVAGSVGSVVGSVGSVTAAVTVGTNNDKAGYQLSTAGNQAAADALLDRDMSVGTDSGAPTTRTVRQALRFLRNKWTTLAGTLTVYKEDDLTTSWTGIYTNDANAQPIVGNDPAG